MRRPYSGPKRTNGEFGVPRPQNQPTTGLATWIAPKLGQKVLKDKWYLFRAPMGGGVLPGPRGPPRTQGGRGDGMGGCLWGFGGGEGQFFFFGPKFPPSGRDCVLAFGHPIIRYGNSEVTNRRHSHVLGTKSTEKIIRRTQEGCGGLRRESSREFPNRSPLRAQALAGILCSSQTRSF